MKITAKQSIFLLAGAETDAFDQLAAYDLYFYLLRDTGYTHFGYALMQDIALYFYNEETPIFNSELTLIHPLRHTIVSEIIREKRLARLKAYTNHHDALSLFAAALTTNMYIDLLQSSFSEVSEEEARQFHYFNDCIEEIFQISFSQNNSYPKKFVQMETTVLQSLRHYVQQHEDDYAQHIHKIHSSIGHYVLQTKELYEVELK